MEGNAHVGQSLDETATAEPVPACCWPRVFALAVALFTASAVYAGLTAQATGTEQVSSGTLNLTLTTGDQGSGSRAPSPARWRPVTWTTST